MTWLPSPSCYSNYSALAVARLFCTRNHGEKFPPSLDVLSVAAIGGGNSDITDHTAYFVATDLSF